MKIKRKITVGTVDVGKEGINLVVEALKRGRISAGANVRRFEEMFADYHNMPYCVAVSTGTDADAIALCAHRYLGFPQRGEVIVPALNFIAVANAVIHSGYTPKFVDIDINTWNIDLHLVEQAVDEETVGIIPTHLFGRPCDMEAMTAVAKKNGLFVVEDSAEAHGAKFKGKLVGTFGDMSTFSFYVAHIITTGEGGAVLAKDERQAEVLRSLRAHGRACSCPVCILNVGSDYCAKRFEQAGDLEDSRFSFLRVGYSSKMNELEASLGIEQIGRLDDIVQARRHNLFYLNKGLEPYRDVLYFFEENEGEWISPLSYPILVRKQAPFSRKQLVAHLEGVGIETRPAFGSIPTQHPAYEYMGHKKGEFPNAEEVGRRGLYIGIHQNLTKDDLDYVIDSFRSFFKEFGES